MEKMEGMGCQELRDTKKSNTDAFCSLFCLLADNSAQGDDAQGWVRHL